MHPWSVPCVLQLRGGRRVQGQRGRSVSDRDRQVPRPRLAVGFVTAQQLMHGLRAPGLGAVHCIGGFNGSIHPASSDEGFAVEIRARRPRCLAVFSSFGSRPS